MVSDLPMNEHSGTNEGINFSGFEVLLVGWLCHFSESQHYSVVGGTPEMKVQEV